MRLRRSYSLILSLMAVALLGCKETVVSLSRRIVSQEVLMPIDPSCKLASVPRIPYSEVGLTCPKDSPPGDGMVDYVYPAQDTLPAPTVADSCLVGFEVNNLKNGVIEVASLSRQGSSASPLEVDIATYAAPDGIRIVGTKSNGESYPLLDTCRIRTSCYGDPTKGAARPPQDSIRAYRGTLKPGTVSLKLDHTLASTPTYVRILGLCEFNLGPLSYSSTLRSVGSR